MLSKTIWVSKQINKINAPKLRRVLSDAQIEWLSDYLSNNKGKRIVAKKVKLIIEQQFLETERFPSVQWHVCSKENFDWAIRN